MSAAMHRAVIALVGDVMLGRLVNESIALHGYAHPWGNILPMRAGADLFLLNLECALTTVTERFEAGTKPFHFRAAPDVVETLRIGNVSFAGIANNHSLDFGVEGLLEMVRVLDAAGIAHAGAGETLEAARRPATLAAGGMRLGVIAAADYPEPWAATAEHPGINYIRVATDAQSFEPIARLIRQARAGGADRLIFCLHCGPNMRERPTAAFRDFAHRVIDEGVDVLWGHSAHVVQGVEFYQRGLILYDTGDFIDDYAVDTVLRNDLSALFFIDLIDGRRPQLRLLPVLIRDMQVNVSRGGERDYFVGRFRRLCEEMATDVHEDADGELLVAAPSA